MEKDLALNDQVFIEDRLHENNNQQQNNIC